MSGVSLQITDVQVIRSGKTILNIDNLSITAGQFINIIGTNGAGKTTLLKVLCGLLKPTHGSVVFDKIPMLSLTSWQRSNLRKQIGYIPQSAEYNPELPFTVREVAAMGRTSVKSLLTNLSRIDYDHVDRWLDKVGLGNQKNQTFSSLSGGERQKVLIARAMVQNPRVLMLDEPTSNLDFHWKLKISSIVQELQSQMNLTVLMISHEIASIPLEANRTILLDKGGIIADGSSEEVLTSNTIQSIYQCGITIFKDEDKKYIVNKRITGL